MVDFTTPSLPGASEVYNKIAQKTDEIEKTVKAGLDGASVDGTEFTPQPCILAFKRCCRFVQ